MKTRWRIRFEFNDVSIWRKRFEFPFYRNFDRRQRRSLLFPLNSVWVFSVLRRSDENMTIVIIADVTRLKMMYVFYRARNEIQNGLSQRKCLGNNVPRDDVWTREIQMKGSNSFSRFAESKYRTYDPDGIGKLTRNKWGVCVSHTRTVGARAADKRENRFLSSETTTTYVSSK